MIHIAEFKGETLQGETKLEISIPLFNVVTWHATGNDEFPTQVNVINDSVVITTKKKKFDEVMRAFYQTSLVRRYN